ncbi:MAG: D-alanine--D-alanine ligase [Bacteroidetes bacterium]|nr:D-alanine--D-alanine ligase [Bacteroidota bacterium]
MNIVLITGGPSSEREVSVSSSKSILKALEESGHNVTLIDPVNGNELISREEIFKNSVRKESPGFEELEKLKLDSNRKILECINSDIFDNKDIVFLGVHGKFGEDGKLQNLLELRGVNYTGSGVFASALAMDKDISKVILEHSGVKTPEWITIKDRNFSDFETLGKEINTSLGFPCVVKPNDEGSTVGLTIVQPDAEDIFLQRSVELAFKYSDKVIIEKYIKGRELTVPVIGDEAYPVIEIRPKDGFYDYEHKYTKGMTDYFCPADLPAALEDLAKEKALTAHKAVGCSVYSRIDFMLDEKNELYCLEVNTLPGMTDTSLVPKSALAKGVNFTQLIEKIIQLSLKK